MPKLTLELLWSSNKTPHYEYEQQRSGATDNTSASVRGVGPSVVSSALGHRWTRVRFTENLFQVGVRGLGSNRDPY